MFFRLSSTELGLIVFGIVLGSTLLVSFLRARLLKSNKQVVTRALLGSLRGLMNGAMVRLVRCER
jgi:hypothetical protein